MAIVFVLRKKGNQYSDRNRLPTKAGWSLSWSGSASRERGNGRGWQGPRIHRRHLAAAGRRSRVTRGAGRAGRCHPAASAPQPGVGPSSRGRCESRARTASRRPGLPRAPLGSRRGECGAAGLLASQAGTGRRFHGWRGGLLGKARELRGWTRVVPAGREPRGAGNRVGLGRASLPPGLLAALTCAAGSPVVLHPRGKSRPPGHGRQRSCWWDSGKEAPARPWNSEVTFPAPGLGLPTASPQTRDRFFLFLGASGPREFGALSLYLRGQHPVRWLLRAREEGKMSPQLWNRSFLRRSSKACHFSPGRWKVGLSLSSALADSNSPDSGERLLGLPCGSGWTRFAPSSVQ